MVAIQHDQAHSPSYPVGQSQDMRRQRSRYPLAKSPPAQSRGRQISPSRPTLIGQMHLLNVRESAAAQHKESPSVSPLPSTRCSSQCSPSPVVAARRCSPPAYDSSWTHAFTTRQQSRPPVDRLNNSWRTNGQVGQPVRQLFAVESDPEVKPQDDPQVEPQVEPQDEPHDEPQDEPQPTATTQADTKIVLVGDRVLQVSRVLGRGAFGVVWEARDELTVDNAAETPIFALKCSQPANKITLAAAVLECEVLARLTAALQHQDNALFNRVPRHITHSTNADNSEVSLLMSKMEGQPLDHWLYGISERRLMEISMKELFEGPLPGGRRGSQRLAGAADAAGLLLAQMAPVFTTLEGIAYHRDISAHNFMVQGSDPDMDFVMIDFGLAVDSQDWKEEWRTANIAGDPRYWSPAVWTNFARGSQHVDRDAGLRRQYEERLDHYSFGILLLEVFFALWEGPQNGNGGDAIAEARAAWHKYWARAYSLFQRFHGNGGQGFLQLREEMVTSNDLQELLSDSRALCIALRIAAQNPVDSAEACEPGVVAARRVLLAAVELIDTKGTLQWSGVPELKDAVAACPMSSSPRAAVPVRQRLAMPSEVSVALPLKRGHRSENDFFALRPTAPPSVGFHGGHRRQISVTTQCPITPTVVQALPLQQGATFRWPSPTGVVRRKSVTASS